MVGSQPPLRADLLTEPAPAGDRSGTGADHIVCGRQRPPRLSPRPSRPRSRPTPSPAAACKRPGRPGRGRHRGRGSVPPTRSAPLDAIVVALVGHRLTASPDVGWEHVLADHQGIVQRLHADAAWTRAAADYSASTDRPIRLVTLTDATTPSGRSRAQASAQVGAGSSRRNEGARHRLWREHRSPRGNRRARNRRTGLPVSGQSRGRRARRGRAGRERGLGRAAQSPAAHRCGDLRRPGGPLVARRRPAGHRPRCRDLE